MTARSDRERIEGAVIDAAVSFVNAPFYAREAKLRSAVREYEAFGLANLSQYGTTSNNSTDTSAQAAASIGDISGLARTCFDEIVLAGGATCHQLTQVLGRPHQTVSARVNDLMRRGWIVDSGLRRPTASGRQAIVWRPTQQALKATR
jgi:hypothetical protein